jgi:hypothetical protein
MPANTNAGSIFLIAAKALIESELITGRDGAGGKRRIAGKFNDGGQPDNRAPEDLEI